MRSANIAACSFDKVWSLCPARQQVAGFLLLELFFYQRVSGACLWKCALRKHHQR